MEIRPVDARKDQAGIIELIDGVYREYGDRVCLENADSDLADLGRYERDGGAFVVLSDAGGRIHGTHAVMPLAGRPHACTFRRLYLDVSLRGQRWGHRLMQWAFDWSAARDFHSVEFWSDTRFQTAHAFFRRAGFVHDGRVREMHDGWTVYREYFFTRVIPREADQSGNRHSRSGPSE